MSKKKNTPRIGGVKWWVIVLIILASLATTIGVFKLTDNLSKDANDLFYNEDNLVRSIEEYEGAVGNTGDGLTWTVNKNRSIRLVGQIDSDAESVEWVLGNVTVTEDGKYTLSGVDGASLTTIYIQGTYTDTDGNVKTFYGDMANSQTVELVEGTVVELKIVAFADTKFSKTINPTFVLGDEAGKF